MLSGCKLRWTQNFPGTRQRAKLVKSTAEMMLVSGLCAQDDRAAPGPACTVIGTHFVPTSGTAMHRHWCTGGFLFIHIDKGLVQWKKKFLST